MRHQYAQHAPRRGRHVDLPEQTEVIGRALIRQRCYLAVAS
jgi:hypothetical protein